jgi:alpha-tubulin suppressor-like RCC1 family protein
LLREWGLAILAVVVRPLAQEKTVRFRGTGVALSTLFFCLGCESKVLEPVRADAISAVSTNVQGITSTALAENIAVRVTDQRGNPMRNTQVSWTVTEGTITPTSSTDDDGVARASWTLGPTLGQQKATAKAGSLSVDVTASTKGIWKLIQIGYQGACGLTTAGTALCWGRNEAGQLGLGAGTANVPDVSRVPVAVATTQKFQTLSIVFANACGVTSTGGAFCWGLNSFGQLGVPIASTPACAAAFDPVNNGKQCTPTAVPVSGGISFASVSAGFRHTCGLARDGRAYCWGRSNEGQLGVGSTDGSEKSTPLLVSGGLTFSSISVGFGYTCGVTTTGQGYCWGNNSEGELGNGTRDVKNVPTLVAGGLTFSVIVGSVAYHTCGISTSQRAYCWGRNEYGQLGAGIAADFSLSPVEVADNLRFISISPGQFHTCGVTTSGAAYCWGADSDGALGYGQSPTTLCTGGTRCSRSPLAVVGGVSFTSVSAANFNSCGVTTLGGAYCWGNNDLGQLGNGTTTRSATPVQVSNPTGVSLP